MQYRSSHRYLSGNANIYGETTVKLSNFISSQSYFAQPIPQESGILDISGFLNSGGSFGSGQSLSFVSQPKDVLFTYTVRETVAQDIVNLVNWTESKIDLIRFGNNLVYQSWPTWQVNNYLSSTINAYNSLVNSDLYDGPNSPISTSGPQFFTMSMLNPPFVPSNIDFYYNTDQVDRSSSELTRRGSKVVKTVSN